MIKTVSRGITHKGMVRKSNQDAYFTSDKDQFYIVADGMGGHAGGEVASALCTSMIKNKIETLFNRNNDPEFNPAKTLQSLSDAVNMASTKIYEKALEEPRLKGMGTTATMVKIQDQVAYFAHVGDSRMYLVRCGFIYQLTHDHSLISEQLAANTITEEEAAGHQLKNVITRSVGYQEEEYVDTDYVELEGGDFLLLCSDGLSGKVADHEICKLVSRFEIDSVDHLLDLANERGGDDNTTVIVIRVCENIDSVRA